MLCGLPTVQQAAIGDCLSFDPFPFDQNGLAPPEVDVGGRQVADALVIAQAIVKSGNFRTITRTRARPKTGKAENADIKMRRRAKTMVLATQSALQAF